MDFVQTSGQLYTATGLNLGIPYDEFLYRTREAELVKPGTRKLIVKKSVQLNHFRSKIFEFGFLVGILLTNSIALACVIAAVLVLLETAAFYSFGDSLKSSSLSAAWTWLRLPAYALYIILSYPIEYSTWIALSVLLVFEGALGILSALFLMIPINMVARLTAKIQGAKELGVSFYHRPRMSIEIKLEEICSSLNGTGG